MFQERHDTTSQPITTSPPVSASPASPARARRIGIPLALLCGLSIVPTTGVAGGAPLGSAQAPRAHAASSYLTGIGDEQGEMFGNPLWQQLHTKIVRYIAPYDAVAHSYSLDRAKLWIREAEAHHQQVLVAFYHSEYTPTRMPSVAHYKHDVQKFVKLFPHVRQYQSWDEANRGNEPHRSRVPRRWPRRSTTRR